MKSNSKAIRLLKGIGVALALPAVVLIVMELLVFTTQGTHVISSGLDVKNLIRGAGISAAIAFALSMNMTSGRMDLSLGSQRITGTILGGVLAAQLGLGGIWIMIFAVVFGLGLGFVVGFLYVTLRIPPMVLGLGIACIY